MKSVVGASSLGLGSGNMVSRKKRLGQYFTGVKLASLLARISFAENVTSAIDPMAGDGDMLVAVSRLSPEAHLYGIELDKNHAESAKQRLDQNACIITGNVFSWETLGALPRRVFDLVITNPPYVRYQYTSCCAEDGLPNAEEVRTGLLNITYQLPDLSAGDRRIFEVLVQSYSGLSDLAVPSWILSAMLVKVGGTLAMVVPESWLTRDYAHPIHYLLIKLFRLRWVVENEARDWFNDAQIKTSLIVAERIPCRDDLSTLRLGENFLCVSLGCEASDNRSPAGGLFPEHVDPAIVLREKMVNILAGIYDPIPGAVILKRELAAKFDDLLIGAGNSSWLHHLEPWVCSQKQTSNIRTAKTPQPLLNLLPLDTRGRLCCLSEIGVNVGQGLRTGANIFFYCNLIEAGNEFSVVTSNLMTGIPIRVPNEVLIPVLHRQSDVHDTYTLDVAILRNRLLMLDRFSPPEAEAPEEGRRLMPEDLCRLVLTAQMTHPDRGPIHSTIPELSAVRTNVSVPNSKNGWRGRHWFMLPPLANRHCPDLFVARINNLHPRTILNTNRDSVIDANFSTIWLESDNKEFKPTAILAVLNSSWCVAAMELLGAVMGGGALKLEATHIRKLPIPKFTAADWLHLADLGNRLTVYRSPETVLMKIDQIVVNALVGSKASSQTLNTLRQINETCLRARKRTCD